MTPDPWFTEQTAGLVGGLLGGLYGGLMIGGIGGGVCSVLAGKGKGKAFVMPYTISMALLGVAMLSVGLFALVSGQPYAVWYPFVLIGALGTGLGGMLVFMCRRSYLTADTRKLDAQSLRRSGV